MPHWMQMGTKPKPQSAIVASYEGRYLFALRGSMYSREIREDRLLRRTVWKSNWRDNEAVDDLHEVSRSEICGYRDTNKSRRS